jgi:hypothetical protein
MDEQGSTASGCAGVVATACTQGKRRQHGKPDGVVGRGDQPEAGDGQRGRGRVAERFAVARKPGNAGGAKGPQFKADAESGAVLEIGATLQTPPKHGSCGRHHMFKRRKDSASSTREAKAARRVELAVVSTRADAHGSADNTVHAVVSPDG